MGTCCGEPKKPDVLQGYLMYLSKFKNSGSEILNEDYDTIRNHLLKIGVTEIKESFIVSVKKESLMLNFYYPCFLCSSPFDLDKEVMVLLNSDKRTKETWFEHFHSIYSHKNQHEQEYK